MKTVFNLIRLSFAFRTITKYQRFSKYTKITGCPIHAVKHFKNNYGFSIIGGNAGQYGDGVNTFELAVLKNGDLCYDTYITNDVLGHLNIREAKKVINKIKKL